MIHNLMYFGPYTLKPKSVRKRDFAIFQHCENELNCWSEIEVG